MQLYADGIIGFDFTTLCAEDIANVLAMRNDMRVASFMYARSVSPQAHKEFIDSLHNNVRSRYWLFKYGEITLGVGSLSRISMGHKHAYLGIYTNPFLQQKQKRALYQQSHFTSVGDMILHALESGARELGLHALYLEVMDSNVHAKAFYERNAYVPQGILQEFMRTRTLDTSANQSYVDVCVYGKVLDSSAVHKEEGINVAIRVSAGGVGEQAKPLDTLASRHLLESSRPLLIAEISANHNQSLSLARHTIKAAKIAGADAIKLQTYTPECLSIDCSKPHFRIDSGTLWDGQNLYHLYKQAHTPFAWHKELFSYARGLGLGIFSSPFSAKALELLESLECPMYKIASFEITDTPFIKLVASTKKPIIISTGIATHQEIMEALQACYDAGNDDITLLLCTSSYPAPLESASIAAMPKLARYGVKYGLSDHTQGDICALLACALGASMIEKHFIIKRSLGGVDAEFSMEAREFQALAHKLQSASLALGSGDLAAKLESNTHARARSFARSLFVCEDIAKGQILTTNNIRSIRPGYGLAPKFLPDILGKRAARDLEKGSPLRWQDFI